MTLNCVGTKTAEHRSRNALSINLTHYSLKPSQNVLKCPSQLLICEVLLQWLVLLTALHVSYPSTRIHDGPKNRPCLKVYDSCT